MAQSSIPKNISAATSPITISGSTITHANSGVTAASKGDTSAKTPGFGGTFKALSATVNATGHLTALAEHTVTMPNIIARYATVSIAAGSNHASISATVNSGETFLCWTSVCSNGWLGPTHIGAAMSQTTNVWASDNSTSTAAREVRGTYLVKKA